MLQPTLTSLEVPELTLEPAGDFQLDTALGFLGCFGPACWRPSADGYQAAHVIGGRALLLHVRQAGRALRVCVHGPHVTALDLAAARALVTRVFSLDVDPTGFVRHIERRDRVLADIVRRLDGLRPVLFSTPFEALCWAILGQRIRMSQATQLKARLTEQLGPKIEHRGQLFHAFPSPKALLALRAQDAADLRLPALKLGRLQLLAERADAGHFDAHTLATLPLPAAKALLEASEGIGAWASEFTLIRAVGRRDLLPMRETRFWHAVKAYYGTDVPNELPLAAWSGFESWAAFWLRVAHQRDFGD